MTDSTKPNFKFMYNLQEAITYRGQTPYQAFGYCGPDQDKVFGFYESQNAAEIDEQHEYMMQGINDLTDIFGIPGDDRSMTKSEYKKGMTGWRTSFPNTWEPDLNPGGGAYHM